MNQFLNITENEQALLFQRFKEYQSKKRTLSESKIQEYRKGVQEFISSYNAAENGQSESLIRSKLEELLSDKDTLECTVTLANVLRSVTKLAGQSLEALNDGMGDHLPDEEIELFNGILNGDVDYRKFSQDSLETINREMAEMICKNYSSCWIVFCGNPMFQKLSDICKNAETKEAFDREMKNTEENTVFLAAAVRDLGLEGKLSGLKKEHAARLSLSWYGGLASAALKIKEILTSDFVGDVISRIQCVFSGLSSFLLNAFCIIGVSIAIKVLLSNLFAIAQLLVITTVAVVAVWLGYDYVAKPLMIMAAPAVKLAANQVKEKLQKAVETVSTWINEKVVPGVKAFCQKANSFLKEKVFIPAANAVNKAVSAGKQLSNNLKEAARKYLDSMFKAKETTSAQTKNTTVSSTNQRRVNIINDPA